MNVYKYNARLKTVTAGWFHIGCGYAVDDDDSDDEEDNDDTADDMTHLGRRQLRRRFSVGG